MTQLFTCYLFLFQSAKGERLKREKEIGFALCPLSGSFAA